MKLHKLLLMGMLASGLTLSACSSTSTGGGGNPGGGGDAPATEDEKPVIDLKNGKATFGIYPQTIVSESDTLEALNQLGSADSHGYHKLGEKYYRKEVAHPFSSTGCLFSDGTSVVEGQSYWFECEPIEWKILSNEQSGYYVLAEKVLDAQIIYHHTDGTHSVIGEKGVFYDNNYKYSDVRNWLLNDFTNMAFIDGTSSIKVTTIDNPEDYRLPSSTNYPTDDLVFLPSRLDLENASYGFNNNDSRIAKYTDYAVAKGVFYSDWGETCGNAYYWTRTANTYGRATYVYYIDDYGSLSWTNPTKVHGIRTALTLKK